MKLIVETLNKHNTPLEDINFVYTGFITGDSDDKYIKACQYNSFFEGVYGKTYEYSGILQGIRLSKTTTLLTSSQLERLVNYLDKAGVDWGYCVELFSPSNELFVNYSGKNFENMLEKFASNCVLIANGKISQEIPGFVKLKDIFLIGKTVLIPNSLVEDIGYSENRIEGLFYNNNCEDVNTVVTSMSECNTDVDFRLKIHLCNNCGSYPDVTLDLVELYQNLDKVSQEARDLINEIKEPSIYLVEVDGHTICGLKSGAIALIGLLLDLEGNHYFSDYLIPKEMKEKYLDKIAKLSNSNLLWENKVEFGRYFKLLDSITFYNSEKEKVMVGSGIVRHSYDAEIAEKWDAILGQLFRKTKLEDIVTIRIDEGDGARVAELSSQVTLFKTQSEERLFMDPVLDFFAVERDDSAGDIVSYCVDNSLSLINTLLTIFDNDESPVLVIRLDEDTNLHQIMNSLYRITTSSVLKSAWERSYIVFINSTDLWDYVPGQVRCNYNLSEINLDNM